MAPENPPPVDPKDALLLRPLASLGKPTTTATSVSFLRRTEYIGTQHGTKGDQTAIRGSAKKPLTDAPARRPEVNKEDAMYIKKYITKGFDIAYPGSRHMGPDTDAEVAGLKPTPAEVEAWRKPVHPSNANLKPVDFYPIIPDLDTFTDDGGFLVFQFKKPPTTTDKHDERVTYGLFRPPPASAEETSRLAELREAHDQDPANNPDPPDLLFDYDFYIPNDKSDLPKLQRKLDPTNPDRDDPALYAKTDEGVFPFDYIRTYETAAQTQLSKDQYMHVAMTLVDPDNDRNHSGRLAQKAAYYYPVISNIRLQPQRQIAFSQTHRAEDWEKADQIYVKVEDAESDEEGSRLAHRLPLDRKLARERNWTKPQEIVKRAEEPKSDVDMVENGENGEFHKDEKVVDTVEDRDASGDEDVDMDGA
jgi:hypothetical protein